MFNPLFSLCRRRDTARTHQPLRTSETRQTFSSFSICPPLPRLHPHSCTWLGGWGKVMIYQAFHSFILSFFLFLSEYVSPDLTSDCSRRRRRIASGSRSPSRRSPCGTGSYTDSYRRAKRLKRRPQELIGSPASFGIMLGTPTAFERKSERGFFNLVFYAGLN